MNLKSKEMNDLYDYGYMIFQNPEYFKFSIDAILLAEFIDVKINQRKILDLCTGNAPIPLILDKKYDHKLDITGVELQKEIYDLAVESIEYNNVDKVKVINMDIKDFVINNREKFDIVSCNPPYFKVTSNNIINNLDIKAKARHEITIDLEDVISIAQKMVKNKGYFYMVHRPERLSEIISLLKKYRFGIKRIVTVYNDTKSRCSLILIEAIYNGENYIKFEQPIFLDQYKNNKSFKNIFRK